MGSRIMHLIIANELTKRLPIKNKLAFLVGGIAPDAVAPKEQSHFYEGDHEKFTRNIAYETFYKKYNSKEDYMLGYFTHLVADDLWLQGFYIPWLKNRMENNPDLHKRYHHDFYLLNGKLLDYYGVREDILDNTDDTIPDLEEVTKKDVLAFIPSLKGDMNYSKEVLEEELQVFTLQQIIGYVETSVNKSIALLKER
ncbi:zinc dependent phospholipase C family protein [Ornithinibacillus halophilus]|uniref:Zinc dependent phospholipase C n=1 Tax=Ornithinibacillus halophilus TaxID=930117 RepID=A0A1M5HRD5_9BACI|nr:zinc dependent phospholipase C family protein [Ornithinibacillus halophilus]SHG18428.1 Zinc dependent phospholipase C [Ornithinibacillus halophilus]